MDLEKKIQAKIEEILKVMRPDSTKANEDACVLREYSLAVESLVMSYIRLKNIDK